jgi:ubiquinone/menaquinone biosynthesis C-methylase UbiE
VGWWADNAVPKITNVACDTNEIREIRGRVCADLHGDVVEIGFGSGLNVPHLPGGVTGAWAVEPSAVGRRLATDRVAASAVPIEFAGLDGQRLDLPDNRFDSALSSFTLCTIPDAIAALRELVRVLKPDGAFHFVEHGRSPDPKVVRWQNILNPLQKRLFAGCHLNRKIDDLIREAGFEIERLETYDGLGKPKAFGYLYEGVARAPRA